MLYEIKKLKEVNVEQMLKAMIRGDKSAIDYAHGFEDALTNIEWFILAQNKKKKESDSVEKEQI